MPTSSASTSPRSATYQVIVRSNGTVRNNWGGTTDPAYRNSRTWVRTPGYHTLVQQGIRLPVNSYDAREISLSPAVTSKLTNVGCTADITGQFYVPQWVMGSNSQDPRNSGVYAAVTRDRAVAQLLGRISDQKANILVSLVEAEKSVSMIASFAKKVNDAYVAVKRGKYSLAESILNIKVRNARDNWLAYRYGWTPLVLDSYGLAELAAKSLDDYFRTGFPFKTSASETWQGSSSTWSIMRPIYGYDASLNYNPRFTVSTKWKVKNQSIAGAWVLPARHWLHDAQAGGLTNPAGVIWELVPYSFVLDWFVHVGNYLQNQSALAGLNIVDGYTGIKSTLTISSVLSPLSTGSNCNRYTGAPGFGSVTDRSYSRRPWSGQLPTFRAYVNPDPLNTKRIIDAVALGLGLSSRGR